MAYAGTPTGLAQQAGASRPWKTVLAAIAVLAIGLALVIAVMFVNSRAVAPATGRDDGVIEAQRDATLLSGAAAAVPAVPVVDDPTYSTSEGVRGIAPATARDDGLIEAQRDATLLSGGKASSAVPAVIDESYYTSAGARNVPAVVDNSQDTIEHMRGFTTVTGTRLDTAWGAAGPADIFDPMLIDQWVSTHGK